jgi:hypothetical protein
LDSPVALAAWMIDHDTDAYLKIARVFVDKGGHFAAREEPELFSEEMRYCFRPLR